MTHSLTQFLVYFVQSQLYDSDVGHIIHIEIGGTTIFLSRPALHVREIFFTYYFEKSNIKFDLAPGFYYIDETQSFISIENALKSALRSDVLRTKSVHKMSLFRSMERTNRILSTFDGERFVRRSMKTCPSPSSIAESSFNRYSCGQY
jgi:hypothetical protein